MPIAVSERFYEAVAPSPRPRPAIRRQKIPEHWKGESASYLSFTAHLSGRGIMTDDTTSETVWITIDEASRLLGTSAKKLLRKLHSKHNTLRCERTASGFRVNAEDVRREVEKQLSEPSVSEVVEKSKGEKTPAGERPFISFDGYNKTYHFL